MVPEKGTFVRVIERTGEKREYRGTVNQVTPQLIVIAPEDALYPGYCKSIAKNDVVTGRVELIRENGIRTVGTNKAGRIVVKSGINTGETEL